MHEQSLNVGVLCRRLSSSVRVTLRRRWRRCWRRSRRTRQLLGLPQLSPRLSWCVLKRPVIISLACAHRASTHPTSIVVLPSIAESGRSGLADESDAHSIALNEGQAVHHLLTGVCWPQMDAEREAIAQRPKTSPGVAMKSRNMCYIIFTSGSTGRPKGTVLQHAGVVNYFLSLVE